MELRQIEYFVVVARHQNFSHAATAIGVAQPALSQQVKRLEEELGVLLLDRTSRPVKVTDAGVAFLARAERMLAEARLAKDEMREFAGVGRGKLVIGALPTLAAFWLPAVLALFHSLHPRIAIVVREENTEELARLLGIGRLDLAVLHDVPGLDSDDASHRAIMMERLFDEELVAIVSPRHPLAKGTSVELAALRNEPFILLAHGSGLTHTIMAATTAEGFTPQVVAESTSMTTLRGLVSSGLGVSVVPRLAACAPGLGVTPLSLVPPLPDHAASVAWRADSRPSAATDALLGVVRDYVALISHPSPGIKRAGE